MTDTNRGPERADTLPSPRDIAHEVARVGRENGIDVSLIIVFGSYADGSQTSSSDADVVVVSPDLDAEDFYARSVHWDWDWNYDKYPGLDIIPLLPGEFRDFVSQSEHIVSTAVETGRIYRFEDTSPG